MVSVLDPEASLTAADVIVSFEGDDEDADCEEEERGLSLSSPDERDVPRSSLLLELEDELDELGFSADRLLEVLAGSLGLSFSLSLEPPEEDELPCEADLALGSSLRSTTSGSLFVTVFSTVVR